MKRFEGFQRGINLGGWMSQCDYSQERLDSFIREEDFSVIASWGLDHVRLPFDYNIVQTADGAAFIEDGFERLARAVALARKNGLNIILDLHKTAGFSFDQGEKETGFFESEAYQERFFRLWEEMARRFGGDAEHVAFELLNEVTDEAYSDAWNRIAAACVARIRPIAPDTWILYGGCHNNHASMVSRLAPPFDSRVVYNFHCYDPVAFTHQGAYWVPILDPDKRVSFEESGASEAYFEQVFQEAIACAERHDTALYCGEYGVIALADAQSTVKWYRAIHAVFERHGIGRAAWSYREMDFDLCGPHLAPFRDELVKLF